MLWCVLYLGSFIRKEYPGFGDKEVCAQCPGACSYECQMLVTPLQEPVAGSVYILSERRWSRVEDTPIFSSPIGLSHPTRPVNLGTPFGLPFSIMLPVLRVLFQWIGASGVLAYVQGASGFLQLQLLNFFSTVLCVHHYPSLSAYFHSPLNQLKSIVY